MPCNIRIPTTATSGHNTQKSPRPASHGRSSVTGKKEFKPKNKGLPKRKHKRKHKRNPNAGDQHTGKFY